MSRPRSFASLRASGEALTLSPLLDSAGPSARDTPAAAGGGAEEGSPPAACEDEESSCATGPAARPACPSPSGPPIRAIGEPIANVSPSFARISVRVPATPAPEPLPLFAQNRGKSPRHIGLVGHVRLVGLDFNQLLADCHLLAHPLQPGEDRPLLHRVREPGHDDVGHQRAPSSASNAALTTCSSCGIAACSRRLE